MSFESEIRELADNRQMDFNRHDKERRKMEAAWEQTRNAVIKPTLEMIVDVAKNYGYMKGECRCENNGCTLKLETDRAKQGEKPSFQLRFALDFKSGKIVSSSDFNGEQSYDLEPVDVSAIESRIRFFFDAFLKILDAG